MKNKITKFHITPQGDIKKYKKELVDFLGFFGIKVGEALVSKDSALGHFPLQKNTLKELEKKFGFKMDKNDLVVDILKKIRNNR